MLLISLVLGILPLVWIAWVAATESMFTVDGLFLSIILLTVSGAFFFNAFLECRRSGLLFLGKPQTASSTSASAAAVLPGIAGAIQLTGTVESIQFFESQVGQSNKSIVVFRPNGSGAARTLVFCGNVGHQLNPGRRVQITYRVTPGCSELLDRDYV